MILITRVGEQSVGQHGGRLHHEIAVEHHQGLRGHDGGRSVTRRNGWIRKIQQPEQFKHVVADYRQIQ